MKPHKQVPLIFPRIAPEEQLHASREFMARMAARRSVRFISPEPVPFELIENAIRCASLAPSGANQQPWEVRCREGFRNQAQDPRGGRG
jgi:iodotyrosine deiodinase